MDARIQTQLIEYGVAALTLPGQDEAGDLSLVVSGPTGVLVAAMDGLGHGAEAAAAARTAASVLRRHAAEPLAGLAQRCHEALRGSRGAVMSLAWFDGAAGTIGWLGVGNVAGVLLRRSPRPLEMLTLRAGVLGDRLPTLISESLPIEPGDTLIFATDGVRSGFAFGLALGNGSAVQHMADQILERYAPRTDDALVLVARYLGASGG
ncbi:MAG: SpoIIE family protein phosphatase [Terriglobales bacterium]